MDNIEELKKYKELLDSGVITQEEFEKKKGELLNNTESSNSDNSEKKVVKEKKTRKKPNKKLVKTMGIIVVIVVAIIVALFAVKKITTHSERTKRATALEEEIQPIMSTYGLDKYTVKYYDYKYDVFAEGFELLTNGQAMEVLEELNDVSIEDPCGKYDDLDFGTMVNVHPGLDVEYSYWLVSSWFVTVSNSHGGNYKTPGIYCNRYGSECVYECDN